MLERQVPFSPDQIGSYTVRFSSKGIFETHKDQMVDPYAATRMPKEFQVEGVQFSPQEKGLFASVVLLHDRWGLTTQVKGMATRLACEGYVVLVPNLYGRQGGMVTANAEVADALMTRLDEPQVLRDINACCEFLNANIPEDPSLEQTKRNFHSVVGFGMGGSLAIRFACHRKKLKSAVAFTGNLPNPEELAKGVYCPVLYYAIHGGNTATFEEIKQFQETAKHEGKQVEIRTYSDAVQGFWDETRSETYHAQIAKDTWEATVDFLGGSLKTS